VPSRGREEEKKRLDGAAAGGERKRRGAREKRNRGEREKRLPKDLCVILENCGDLSIKYNFSLI
jgi:hypothetical protein